MGWARELWCHAACEGGKVLRNSAFKGGKVLRRTPSEGPYLLRTDTDLTEADDRWRGPRRKEILRTREYFCRVFFDPTIESGAEEFLQEYFLYFAQVARHSR